MSRVIAYLDSALQGAGRYLESNKLIVPVLALLLAWWLVEKKTKEEKVGKLFGYTLIMSIVLLCPVTAMFVLIYQTGYYDYEWAWSMVPVTAMIAYGAVCLVQKGKGRWQSAMTILGVAAVLCLCGNQGTLQTVKGQDAAAWENTSEVLEALYDCGMTKEKLMWAPKNMMEQVRRQDGKILLIYGRDMWDVKSGSYDYEVYSEAVTAAYVWLEVLCEQADIASIMADPAASFSILCAEEDLNRARETHLCTVLDAGANVLVLPHLVAEHIKESILELAEERQLKVQNAYTEEYTIYLLE